MDNIYSTLSPIFYVCKVLGLAPLNIVGDGANVQLHLSKKAIAYSVLILIVLLVTSTIALLAADFSLLSGGSNLFATVSKLKFSADVVISGIIMIMCFINTGKVVQFFNDINKIDEHLKDIDLNVPHSYTKRFVIIQVIICSFFIAFSYIFIFLNLLGNKETPIYLKRVCYRIALHTSKLITLTLVGQFIGLILLLKQRFKLIRDPLHSLVEVYNYKKPDEVLKMGHGHKTIFVKSKGDSATTVVTIKHLRTLHDRLCGMASLANSMHSLQVMLIVASSFVYITSELYSTFTWIIRISEGSPTVSSYTVNSFYLNLLTIFQTVVLCASCEICSREANGFTVLVNRLMIRATDANTSNELQLFSMQLLHSKVKFSACGLFPLDATLLFGMVGGVTTYLIILVQFQLSAAPVCGGGGNLLHNSTSTFNNTV